MTSTGSVAVGESLLRAPGEAKYELVDGEIRACPTGARHGAACARLGSLLVRFAAEQGLGYVFDSNTGFRLPGGNVRLPDVTFVAKGRFPYGIPVGVADLSPDLAVEILHPDDRPRDILNKVGEYLQVGVPLVWVIDPARRVGVVHRSVSKVRRVGPDDFLDGEEALPGFRCRLAEVCE